VQAGFRVEDTDGEALDYEKLNCRTSIIERAEDGDLG